MDRLTDILTAPERRPQVVADCVALIDSEVASKSGLAGLAIKGAYAVVKKVRPGIIRSAADWLLEPFAERLQPFYERLQREGGDIETLFAANASDIANALLGVTDERIASTDQATVKKAYEKLRPTGERHVLSAVPGVAKLLSRHIQAASN